jgi:hypothetical protein
MEIGFDPQLQEFGLYTTSNKLFMREVMFVGKPAFQFMLQPNAVRV